MRAGHALASVMQTSGHRNTAPAQPGALNCIGLPRPAAASAKLPQAALGRRRQGCDYRNAVRL